MLLSMLCSESVLIAKIFLCLLLCVKYCGVSALYRYVDFLRLAYSVPISVSIPVLHSFPLASSFLLPSKYEIWLLKAT
ncbi:hypothetical protein RJT34_31357 [Clitoria ternatea]|uniref:Uncharacterized protein n=1 Tax=Clitoria ternatea TaxID=43366 RepID=A0AAN9EYF7_CLITE